MLIDSEGEFSKKLIEKDFRYGFGLLRILYGVESHVFDLRPLVN